ncbi:MAG: 16S rRNA (guanine(966)-N(2))-methyltransferase RsmD [Candidatus Omnitrophica bacterium]|nr:16S rRNA (guanine(966)-N(2))-methyltransferase RsmD [Candidatus Omnitrophota bacterium]MCM8790370.1 16S rRNA (guanine(966)-N(2))-methyltransferase RsmD [Candidatus Omnitrophota bacterium]
MPRGVRIRPTQDKVREAIFNFLGDISGKKVLELFAGSGAFGIEALSRGVSHVTFVDNNFRCAEAIKANLDSLGISDSLYDIIRANAISVLVRLSKSKDKFDIVFSDPPYHEGYAKKCLINLDSYDIVAPTGVILIEHFKKDILTADLNNLVFDQDRRYGDTVVSIYRKAA